MKAMIQIRNVPEKLHRDLKVRSAQEGISMSQFILREIQRALERPSRIEVLRRIAERGETHLPQPAADILREERDSR
jgi:plasmid stability protein